LNAAGLPGCEQPDDGVRGARCSRLLGLLEHTGPRCGSARMPGSDSQQRQSGPTP